MRLQPPTIAQKSGGWNRNEFCNFAAVVVWLAKQIAPPPIAGENESAKSLPWRLSLHTSLQLIKQLLDLKARHTILAGKHSSFAYHLMVSRLSTQYTAKQKAASHHTLHVSMEYSLYI